MRKLPLMAVLLATACTMGPDYERPALSLPSQWPWGQGQEHAPVQAASEMADWWKQFSDPVLNQLMEEGLASNADLLIAAARISQARAQLNLADAQLYPQLDMEGVGERIRGSTSRFQPGGNAAAKPYNNFGLAAVLTYEINLWGKLTRETESRRALLLANEANRDAIRLAVISDIAAGYFNLRAIDAQLAVTEETIKAREEALRYQDAQYRYGAIDQLAAKQAESELAAAQAQAPALKQARQEQEMALAIVLGRTPQALAEGAVERGEAIDALPVPPAVAGDMPSTMLERRPDIRAAEQNLVSANADIGAARADYFPSLSLSALIGLESSKAGELLRASTRRWDAGATLAGPIVDFGRTAANVETAEAYREEAQAAYQQTVRQAFADVINAMSAEATTAAHEAAQQAQEKARLESLRLANIRYRAGYSSYLDVLDAQRTLYQVQLDRIIAKRDRLVAVVNLYKSLGGGWAVNSPLPEQASLPEIPKTPLPEELPALNTLGQTPNPESRD